MFGIGKAYGMRSLLIRFGRMKMNKKMFAVCLLATALLWTAACSQRGSDNVANNNDNRLSRNTNRDNAATYSTTPTISSNAANNASTTGSAMTDADFMKEAAVGGMAEVEGGRLAATKAASPEVKKFGQMMIEEHSKANTELKALAVKKNIAVPTALDADKQSMMDELRGLSGAAFDDTYIEGMVGDHEKTVATFERESQNASDPDIKAFAAKTLPTLRKHLDAVKAIQAKMK